MMREYDAFLESLKDAKSILIASHSSPDGDGIGSIIALGLALETLGKEVTMYSRDPVPENLRFLPETDRFHAVIPEGASYDMAIMVDCGQRARISEEFARFSGFRFVACIDHHKLEKVEADLCILDGEGASTGAVVMRLMEHAGLKMSAAIAQCIYTTLVVDTGFFKYSTTDAAVLKLAGALVEAGADPWTVAKNLEESFPPSRLLLLAQSLATLHFELDQRYASMEVTQRMLAETQARMEFSDEFAIYPRSVRGVEVSALFRELPDGVIKVSLRSKDRVDVAAVAAKLGGGGHARAAGVRIRAKVPEAKEQIRRLIEEALSSEGGA